MIDFRSGAWFLERRTHSSAENGRNVMERRTHSSAENVRNVIERRTHSSTDSQLGFWSGGRIRPSKHLAMRPLAIAALIAALAPWAAAQRAVAHFSGSHAVPPFAGSGRSAFARAGRGFYRDRYSPYSYVSLPFPFFDDAYDSGDIYSTGYPVAAALPPYLPPTHPYAEAPQNSSSSEPSQPLLIELQNGRYVQTSVTAVDGEALPLDDPDNAKESQPLHRVARPEAGAHVPAAASLAAMILIFRDGHSEHVRDYTIADGTLYAQGDFYTDGYWNKQIALSALDIPKTLQANSAQGVTFTLPSSPNEVITRF